MKLDRTKIAAVREIARFLEIVSPEDFVLHGSPRCFAVAEPRAAQGNPEFPIQCQRGVYASMVPEYAIVHALFRDPSYRLDPKRNLLVVHGHTLTARSGYIHVLPLGAFEPVDDGVGGIWRIAREPVPVLASIHVGPEILPHFPLIAFQCAHLRKRA